MHILFFDLYHLWEFVQINSVFQHTNNNLIICSSQSTETLMDFQSAANNHDFRQQNQFYMTHVTMLTMYLHVATIH